MTDNQDPINIFDGLPKAIDAVNQALGAFFEALSEALNDSQETSEPDTVSNTEGETVYKVTNAGGNFGGGSTLAERITAKYLENDNDEPHSECESVAEQITADGLLAVLFFKYRKLEPGWLVRRKQEIDQIFQFMTSYSQTQQLPGLNDFNEWLKIINMANQWPFENIPNPRRIQDNPQA